MSEGPLFISNWKFCGALTHGGIHVENFIHGLLHVFYIFYISFRYFLANSKNFIILEMLWKNFGNKLKCFQTILKQNFETHVVKQIKMVYIYMCKFDLCSYPGVSKCGWPWPYRKGFIIIQFVALIALNSALESVLESRLI